MLCSEQWKPELRINQESSSYRTYDVGNDDSLEQASQFAYLKGQTNDWRPKQTGKFGCYICGDRHAWRYCPEKMPLRWAEGSHFGELFHKETVGRQS